MVRSHSVSLESMEQLLTFAAHHWQLVAALVIILALLAGTEVLGRLRGARSTDALQATQLINHQDAVMLDVREDSEHKDGHILNSVHIPLSRLPSSLQQLEKYKSRPIIVGCRSGHRSSHGCAVLRKNGFATVYNLKGGIMGWQNANLPLYKK